MVYELTKKQISFLKKLRKILKRKHIFTFNINNKIFKKLPNPLNSCIELQKHGFILFVVDSNPVALPITGCNIKLTNKTIAFLDERLRIFLNFVIPYAITTTIAIASLIVSIISLLR